MRHAQALGFERRARRARLANLARRAALQEWRKIDADAIRLSYASVYPRILMLVSEAQERSASGATEFLEAALSAQGDKTADLALVNAAAFRGLASDGRSLATLLNVPLFSAINALARGVTPAQALGLGAAMLDRIVATQVVDAGRVSDGVAIAGSRVAGYVRVAAPPCCSRCAILGGQFYKWSAGFERHPYCDCFNVPVNDSRTQSIGRDPMALFRAGLIHGMPQADIDAVNGGADLNKVVNARRGMYAAASLKASPFSGTRLMPEQIYREADTRDQAIGLLRANGFLS